MAGIRVLDFGRFVAGPFCAALLADHGADVIRIDRIGGSEDRFVRPLAQTGEGSSFMQNNRGKRSLCLEPTSAEGREIVRRLVVRADIVIANLPVSTLKSMGLDYATLSAINPRVILVTTNAFGRTGPDAHKVGFNGVAEALSGTMYLGGDPGAPRRAAGAYVDYATAISAAFGAVLALLARERTGRGQEVSGSLMASALTISNSILIERSKSAKNLTFLRPLPVVAAARRSLGVAIASRICVSDLLSTGELVVPFALQVRTTQKLGYSLVRPARASRDSRLDDLRDWLRSELEA